MSCRALHTVDYAIHNDTCMCAVTAWFKVKPGMTAFCKHIMTNNFMTNAGELLTSNPSPFLNSPCYNNHYMSRADNDADSSRKSRRMWHFYASVRPYFERNYHILTGESGLGGPMGSLSSMFQLLLGCRVPHLQVVPLLSFHCHGILLHVLNNRRCES